MQQEYSFLLRVIIFAILVSQLSKATRVLFCKKRFQNILQGTRQQRCKYGNKIRQVFFRLFAGGRGTITLNIASFKFKLGNLMRQLGYTFACRVIKSENIVTWEYQLSFTVYNIWKYKNMLIAILYVGDKIRKQLEYIMYPQMK